VVQGSVAARAALAPARRAGRWHPRRRTVPLSIAVPLRMQQKREERQVKIKLGDAPGAADLVARLVAATSDMALAFVGEPDEKVRAHLERRRDGFERKLAEEIGAGTAREIVPVLFGAVLAEKARLERNWGGARN
jgi:hypothetical protein